MHGGRCIHVEFRPHQKKRLRLATCMKSHCDNPYYYLANLELPLPFLRTCRQAYHEARNVFYTANIFRIGDPRVGRLFLQRISDYSLTLRSVHLNICVTKRKDEREWDDTLQELAENFKTVQKLYIDVRETLWNMYECYSTTRRHSPAVGKKPFIRGLLELKKLPLKTFELSVWEGSPRNQPQVPTSVYSWTPDQKRAWVRSMKSAILSKD